MGTLTLGSTVNTGTIHGAAGTALRFLGPQTSTGAIEGHRITFASDTANIGGSFSAQQTEIFNTATFTGTVQQFGPLTLNGVLDLTNATVADAARNLPSLTLAGSLVTGLDLSVAGLFTIVLRDGSLVGVNGQGTLTANGGTNIAPSHFFGLRNGFRFINPVGQTVSWSVDAGISVLDTSQFINHGLLDILVDAQISSSPGAAGSSIPGRCSSGGAARGTRPAVGSRSPPKTAARSTRRWGR